MATTTVRPNAGGDPVVDTTVGSQLMQGTAEKAKVGIVVSAVTTTTTVIPSHPITTVSSTLPKKRSRTPKPLPYLPTEIIQEILCYLSPHDYDAARLACRDWFESSQCRPLLQQNIQRLSNVPNTKTSLRANFFSPQAIYSVKVLRRLFSTLVTEWPGSRYRVPCMKTRLDAGALIDIANRGNPNLADPITGFECVGFSRQTGSFAAIVVGRRADRKMYIYRIFSKTHKTLESRPHRRSCCPCVPDPGPLYLSFEIKTVVNHQIVKLEMEEIENPSSVKELSITYDTGTVETYTFEGLAPHQIYQLNLREKTVRTAAMAHVHAPTLRQQSIAPQLPFSRFKEILMGIKLRFQKAPTPTRANPVVLEIKPAPLPSNPSRMRVRLSLTGMDEVCHVLHIPLNDAKDNMAVLALSKTTKTLYVCRTSSSNRSIVSQSKDKVVNATLQYWLRAPSRPNCTAEITHISVAPLMHYDFGQLITYMGILLAYSNGEIWLWRVDRTWSDLQVQGSGSSRRPAQTPSVSTTIPPPLDVPPTKQQEASLPVLQIMCSPEEPDLEDSNAKAWKLAYLPGLKALNFVDRGVVILAADGKNIYNFDLREANGYDRNFLNPPLGFGFEYNEVGEVRS